MPLYLLDTNLLLAYVRGGVLYEALEALYELWSREPIPVISVVSDGKFAPLPTILAGDALSGNKWKFCLRVFRQSQYHIAV